jgi:hypothetical protein
MNLREIGVKDGGVMSGSGLYFNFRVGFTESLVKSYLLSFYSYLSSV